LNITYTVTCPCKNQFNGFAAESRIRQGKAFQYPIIGTSIICSPCQSRTEPCPRSSISSFIFIFISNSQQIVSISTTFEIECKVKIITRTIRSRKINFFVKMNLRISRSVRICRIIFGNISGIITAIFYICIYNPLICFFTINENPAIFTAFKIFS